MNDRLTLNEFDFLKMTLRTLEKIGNESLMRGLEVSDYGQTLVGIFGRTSAQVVRATDQMRLIREKLENIAG